MAFGGPAGAGLGIAALGTGAGRGRREESARGRPAVASPKRTWPRIERRLDGYVQECIKRTKERREQGKKPLKRDAVPQRRVTSPDRVLRAAIGEALARIRAAPVVPEGLYLDDADDTRPVPPTTVRATLQRLAAMREMAELDAQVTIPRGKGTLLARALVRHVLPDHPEIAGDPSQPLGPTMLALIGERAARLATSYRERGGERRNLAREHLRWELSRAIEARCGEGSARFGWVDVPPSPIGRGVEPSASGLLFDILWELRPWLPGLADAAPRRLYDAFVHRRKRSA